MEGNKGFFRGSLVSGLGTKLARENDHSGKWRYFSNIIYFEGYPAVQFPVYHLSNGKRSPWLFRVYIGDEILPSYEGIIS